MLKKKNVKNILIDAVKNTNLKCSKDLIKENSYKVKSSEIVSKGPRIVNFDDGVRRVDNIKINLAEWTNRDFGLYVKQQYYKKFKHEWSPTATNITIYFNNIKEAVNDIVGFCDNIVMKEYIDYFFSKWAEFYRDKSKNILYLNSFKKPDAISDFYSIYNYTNSIKKYTEKKEVSTDIILTEDILNKSYLLGIQNFILEFGLIIPCCWLINRLNYNIKSSVNMVAKAFLVSCKKNNDKEVLKNTKKYEPYPNWFPFKKYEVILLAVEKKTKNKIELSVAFNDTQDKYDFLRRKM